MDVHELTAAYALDALDATEREAYEAHLGGCAECREELARLGETAATLAWGVASPAPPAALRSRLLAAAAAERASVVPLPPRRSWAFRATAAAAAVAACAAIGFGVWAGTLSHSLDTERSARAAEARAVAVWMDPAAKRVALEGGRGMLAVDRAGNGVLVVRQLPAAPKDKVYEAWVIRPGAQPVRAGTFAGGRATTLMLLEKPVPPGSTVAATVEAAGGVDVPTQAPFMTART